VTSPWLPIVWPFKFMIPATAVLLVLQGVAECIRSWYRAFRPDDIAPPAAAPDDEGSVVI